MREAITFIPGSRTGIDNQGIHYIEHASRHRSIYALFQDDGPRRSDSRHHFLLKAYREVVSRFVGFGKIEHPLPFLRQLVQVLDALSRSVDCRVDDFEGIGLSVLIQDANTFYVLTSRSGRVAFDTGGGLFEPVETPGIPEIRELPLDTTGAQKELFSQTMRDYLSLFRLDAGAASLSDGPDGTLLRVVMGGTADDARSVIATIAEPGAVSGHETAAVVEHSEISQRLLYVSFPRTESVRDPVLDALRVGTQRPRSRTARLASAAVVVVLFGTLATVWVTARLGSESSETMVADVAPAQQVASATQEASPRLQQRTEDSAKRVAEVIETPEREPAEATTGADVGPVKMAVEWRNSYEKAVTTTPVVDGDGVIFGSRDGGVYALDRWTGEVEWRYVAGDGVGASPVVAGGSVVGADYKGNVFCLDRKTGVPLWTRTLPAKVVSTPCVAGGEVLVGCTDSKGYGLSLETGRILWTVTTGGRIRASAVSAGGRFYLASYDGRVYAITQGSGAERWTHEVGGPLSSTPAADETRVVVGGGRGVYAIDAETGFRQWRYRTPAPVKSSILMVGGRVFAGCNDHHVYCLDAATGEFIWKARTGEVVMSRPRLEGDLLFVTSYDKAVYCFDAATGEPIDRLETGGPIYSSPVIDGDFVFFGNNEGEFYCINYRSARP